VPHPIQDRTDDELRQLADATLEEILRQIIFAEPKRLRQLNRAIPVDLETVVLKAMAPDLRRRRDQLELQVLQLRDGRGKLPDDDYYRRMEPLVLELARLYQRAEKK